FQYLEMELSQLAEACRGSGALLKVNLEDQYLTEELKIVACRVVKRAGADFIATSNSGDLPLLKEYSRDRLQLKCAPSASDPDTIVPLYEAGWRRIQCRSTQPVLAAIQQRLEAQLNAAQNAGTPG